MICIRFGLVALFIIYVSSSAHNIGVGVWFHIDKWLKKILNFQTLTMHYLALSFALHAVCMYSISHKAYKSNKFMNYNDEESHAVIIFSVIVLG